VDGAEAERPAALAGGRAAAPASAMPAAALGEFALIERYFSQPSGERQGIGDDCALIDVGEQTLAISSDMLLEGVHFLPGADPEGLGHKALAVNLSDLAAAGARPRCFLLDLALPCADGPWLEAFARGMFALAGAHGCTLVGGDTTRAPRIAAGPGPLCIAITVIGEVDRRSYQGRSGARPGDDIWVSGQLGEAALALAHRRGELCIAESDRAACLLRMDRPQPRVALGRALAGVATAMIDVSDGLLGDLGHILERSHAQARGATQTPAVAAGAAFGAQQTPAVAAGAAFGATQTPAVAAGAAFGATQAPAVAAGAAFGATLFWPQMPRAGVFGALPRERQYRCVLAGGDDYELVFTARPADRAQILRRAAAAGPVARVGRVESAPGIVLRDGHDGDGARLDVALQSFDHFLSAP